MSVAIANERIKLAANAMDRASTACLAVGIFSPVAGLMRPEAAIPILEVMISFGGWLVAAIVLHFLARRTLGGIQ